MHIEIVKYVGFVVVAYVCQTIAMPLFVRPRMHIFARYLFESGIGHRPIILEEHQRLLEMAQREKPEVEPRLESAVLKITYQMYAVLNVVALGIFIGEICWFEWHSMTL